MTTDPQSPSEHEEPEDALAAARAAVIQVLTTTSEHREQILDAARRERERILSSARAEVDGILANTRAEAEGLLANARSEADGMLNNARADAEQARQEAVSVVSEARSVLPEVAALDSRLGYLIDRLGKPIDQPARGNSPTSDTDSDPGGPDTQQNDSEPTADAHAESTEASAEEAETERDSGSPDDADAEPPQAEQDAAAQAAENTMSSEDFERFLNQLADHLEHLDRARSTGDRSEVGRVLHDLSDLAAQSEVDELADLARHLGPDARPDQLDELISQCYEVRQTLAGRHHAESHPN